LAALGRNRRMAGAAGLATCLMLAISATAMAESPEAGLIAAEGRAVTARAEVSELETARSWTQSAFENTLKRAAPVRSEREHAVAQVGAIEASLRQRHLRAAAEVTRIEKERNSAAEKHDDEVSSGVGVAIAALIMALIAFSWGWFRASAAVAYLVRIELGQAIGLCVGGGFVLIVAGAGLSSADGAVGAIGTAILCLGLMVPVALLLARHSAEVQRGRANPLLRRERLPVRATQAITALFAALFLIGLGAALFAGEAQSDEINSEMRQWAEAKDPPSPALAAAEHTATKATQTAAPLLSSLHERQAALRRAKRDLTRARARLSAAERDRAHFARQLHAIEKRKARELAREAREAERVAEEEQRELEEAEEQNAEPPNCDPNYEGACLTPGIGDYDCAGGSGDGPNYVSGPVAVVGADIYGLDANGNGIGCEDE
jgi:hypothetical protein